MPYIFGSHKGEQFTPELLWPQWVVEERPLARADGGHRDSSLRSRMTQKVGAEKKDRGPSASLGMTGERRQSRRR